MEAARDFKKLPNGIEICGWLVESTKKPMLASEGKEKWTEELQLPDIPEMVFPDNGIKFTHKESGFSLDFDTKDALEHVDKTKCDVEVAAAQKWQKSKAEEGGAETLKHLKERASAWDWTYTSRYSGTVSGGAAKRDDSVQIDIEHLKRPDPILFWDHVILFEDELADNGHSLLSAKVRVMPTCFFLLLRQFIRVDNVIFRSVETRVFHMFGTQYVVREHCWRQSTYAELGRALPTDPTKLSDENVMIPLLAEQEKYTERISIGEEQVAAAE